MIGSCKTLVLYTFVKTWFKLRDYLFFLGNDQVLLTEKQSADNYYYSAKSSGTRETTFKLAVEKFKLFTNAIFSMVKVIFSTILVIPTYILPHLVPSHIANLMSIAEATTTNQEEENEVTTVLKKSTYFLHDIYNWNGNSNGNSNGTRIPPSNQNSDEYEFHGEMVEEISYVRKILRNIVDIFVWTRKSVSRILSRSTRVALTAPKTR
jgi:hypothetical protein